MSSPSVANQVREPIGHNPARQSMLLASRLKGVSVENPELHDLDCDSDYDVSLAIVGAGTAGVSEVQVYTLYKYLVDELAGFAHG